MIQSRTVKDLVTQFDLFGFLVALEDSPGDEATICACVDHLQIQGATTAEVVRMYAGDPPDWHYGPVLQKSYQDILKHWCKHTEPDAMVPIKVWREVCKIDPSWNQYRIPPRHKWIGAAFFTSRTRELFVGLMDIAEIARISTSKIDGMLAELSDIGTDNVSVEGILRNYCWMRKRETLAMFPEIEWEQGAVIHLFPGEKMVDPPAPILNTKPWKAIPVEGANRKHEVYQTLAAPDWMPVGRTIRSMPTRRTTIHGMPHLITGEGNDASLSN